MQILSHTCADLSRVPIACEEMDRLRILWVGGGAGAGRRGFAKGIAQIASKPSYTNYDSSRKDFSEIAIGNYFIQL